MDHHNILSSLPGAIVDISRKFHQNPSIGFQVILKQTNRQTNVHHPLHNILNDGNIVM